MMQPPLDLLEEWCEQRTAPGSRARLEVETSPSGAVIMERRLPLIGALARGPLRRELARLRFSAQSGWSLEWRDGRHWRRYSRLAPTFELSDVLAEIDRDPCGLFWRSSGNSGGEERSRDIALA